MEVEINSRETIKPSSLTPPHLRTYKLPMNRKIRKTFCSLQRCFLTISNWWKGDFNALTRNMDLTDKAAQFPTVPKSDFISVISSQRFRDSDWSPTSAPSSTKVWNMIKLLSTPTTTPALFGGSLLGYVLYDVTHYYLHHGQPTGQVTRHLKKYHLNHHFRIQDKGFGITSSIWDKVFGTLPQSKAAGKGR
ncbi:uncharacterized protein LOC114277079 [Camellia sinensis]|uniref:uncharacterized protein LOC114277079 n=1 Tax=Camellia sinensis TaxID=4442 RepID=UPI00103678EE|nr:uncharacterized protein LOC114277079 [Camellia sinensis]